MLKKALASLALSTGIILSGSALPIEKFPAPDKDERSSRTAAQALWCGPGLFARPSAALGADRKPE